MTQKLIKQGSSDAKQLEFLWWQKCLTDTLNLEIVQKNYKNYLFFFFWAIQLQKFWLSFEICYEVYLFISIPSQRPLHLGYCRLSTHLAAPCYHLLRGIQQPAIVSDPAGYIRETQQIKYFVTSLKSSAFMLTPPSATCSPSCFYNEAVWLLIVFEGRERGCMWTKACWVI